MTETGNDRDHVQSLERGFAVLGSFSREHPRPSLAELAAVTGYSRPAVRRLLLTLQRLGYVDNEGPRWFLTPRVLSIAAQYDASHSLAGVAQPHLVTMAERTRESASLGVLDGDEVVYVARVPAQRVVNVSAHVGTRVAAHTNAMGRVLLAAAPPARVERYLVDPGLRAMTPHTITDHDRFRAALERARHQGWCLVSEEREIGLISASAPVRDHTGAAVAAVTTSSSTGRSSPGQMEQHLVPVLTETADRISAALGEPEGAAPTPAAWRR